MPPPQTPATSPAHPRTNPPTPTWSNRFRPLHVGVDRKSTRLNSSHRCISYAAFSLEKQTLTGTLAGCISQFSYAGPRFGFMLMIIFGSIGLILVFIGVYSAPSDPPSTPTQDLGI